MIAALVGGTALAAGSVAWPVAWIGLELNLLGFVPLAITSNDTKKPAMFYFVVQRVGSLLLLFGGISGGTVALLSILGLLLKMGLAPVHFWVPPVAGRLSRWMFGLLLTWQKLAPLSLLLFITLSICPLIALNVIVGAVVMLATRSLQPLLVFRGLIQIG